MSVIVLRLIDEEDKAAALLAATSTTGMVAGRYLVDDHQLRSIPGSPLTYWTSEAVRSLFRQSEPFEDGQTRNVRLGASTKNDARFVRLWFEVHDCGSEKWSTYANGSKFGRFFQDYYTVVNSGAKFHELAAYLLGKFAYLKGDANWILHGENDYSVPVIGWPLRKHAFSPHAVPAKSIFSARTYATYVPDEQRANIAGLMSSSVFD